MNKTKEYDFTIIVPIYNEEDNMTTLEKQLSAYVAKASLKTCVLLINDGSTDDSLARIKQLCQRQPHFYYISSNANHGLSTAMKAGIDETESKYLGYIDADLQTRPDDFEKLLQYAPTTPLVTGIRANRKDSGFKKLQ